MTQNPHDHARLSVPSQSGPSRRTVLRAAGALGIAGVALRSLPARAATSPPLLSFAGANEDAFATMLSTPSSSPSYLSAMPTGVRVYRDAKTYPNTTGYDGVSWPDITQMYNSSAHAVVSIRPEVSLLTQGNFDASLHAFMLTAPAGTASLLTMWHEAATDSLDPTNNYPTHPDLFREGLARMQALAAGQIPPYGPTNVKVGVIDVNPSAIPLSAYSSAQDAYSTWMAANLDWYGCDLYDNKDLTLSAYDELNQFRDLVNTLPGSLANADAPINLPECNSRAWKDAQGVVHSTMPTSGPTGFRRSDFFHYAWAWLQNVGPASHLSGLLGFWRKDAPEGSPSGWPPVDDPAGSLAAMVAELSAENADSWP